MILVSLFCCCEKVFTHMNKWMIEKNSMKHYQKKKIFTEEDITNSDYAHAKRVSKHFKINKLGEYRDLFVQGYTFLLVDLFQNFQNFILDPAHFFTTPGLAW